MNGPEHYREAEKITDHAEEHAAENSGTWYIGAMLAAQVHATLALAAATAEAAPESPTHGPLVQRPMAEGVAFHEAPASPGSPWGQVLFTESKED